MTMQKFFIALTFLIFPLLAQANWPEFRGPTGQGHVPKGADLPLEWGLDENVTWRVDIPGKGWSSPVIVNGIIYLTTAVADGDDQDAQGVDRSLRALALDAETGDILWNTEVFRQDGGEAPKIHKKNSHASPTPVFAYDHLFVHFGHQGTACLKLDGSILWKNQELEYNPVHGNGGTPVVVGDKLIFSCDGPPDPFVVALNVRDGEVAWKTRRNTDASRKFSFSTPLLIEANGRPELVLPGSGNLYAYDPKTGEELWRVNWDEGYSVVPRPVYSDGLVYAASGFNTAVLYAVKPGGSGDVTDSHVAWTSDDRIPKNASFLIVDDELYTANDQGVINCFDAKTGEIHWQERVVGPTSASPLHSNGRIYILDEQGECAVLNAGTEYEQLATNDLDERTLATPAVAGDALFIRTETGLYRIEK